MAIGRLIGAVAGAAGIGAVGIGYAGIAGQDDTTRDEETGEVVEGGEIGAFRIRVGDCLADVTVGEFESAEAVPCSTPHLVEVYAAFNLEGDLDAPFPGVSTVTDSAEAECLHRFAPFVDHPFATSIFDIQTITPAEEGWQRLDDREVLCLIGRYDGSLKTGSAEGAGR